MHLTTAVAAIAFAVRAKNGSPVLAAEQPRQLLTGAGTDAANMLLIYLTQTLSLGLPDPPKTQPRHGPSLDQARFPEIWESGNLEIWSPTTPKK